MKEKKGKRGVSPEEEFLIEIVGEDYFEDFKSAGTSIKSGKKAEKKHKAEKKRGDLKKNVKNKRSGTSPKTNRGGKNAGRKGRSRKARLKPWMKVMLGAAVFLLVIAAGLFGGFVYLRAEGEKNLKTNVAEIIADTEVEEEEKEGLFVTYKGKEYQYNEDIINFLCMGIDKTIPIGDKVESTRGQGNADVIMLVSINLESGSIQILAIPRDTMVPVKEYNTAGEYLGSNEEQITSQHTYGLTEEKACELMVEAVSNLLYNVPIQRYCSINIQAVPLLNDAVGGVDVEVLETMEGAYGTYNQGDVIHLEGDRALEYIRKRDKEVFGGVLLRLGRQKQYLMNYFEAAKHAVAEDLTLPVTIYQQLLDNQYMYTNITLADITYLVPELLNISLAVEDMATIPGELTKPDPDSYVEYHVNEEELKELVIQRFYEEAL